MKWWREFLCAIGLHEVTYRIEHTPFKEHGKSKMKASVVRCCLHCPNGRKVIVDRSLLLGD